MITSNPGRSFSLCPARLRRCGFCTSMTSGFVVTNQAMVSRGLTTHETLREIHARMALHVTQHGGAITDIRYCPHDTHEQCSCRKPRPGMVLDLAARWNIDLSQSYLIGDAWTDMAAAHAANCRCIMVQTGRGAEHAHLPEALQHPAHHLASNLLSAVQWLCEAEFALPQSDPAPRAGRRATMPLGLALSVGG